MCKFYGTCFDLLKAAGTGSFYFLERDTLVQSARRRPSMCSNAYTNEVRFKLCTVYLAGVPSD